jgi:ATP-dependent helicase/nuclease subunit B
LIRLPTDLSGIIQQGGTLVVPTRQRAHAARLGHAAAQLSEGLRVWSTPDILAVDAWLIREVELHASVAGVVLPRLLSPAEDWLLWRQCTAEMGRDLELLNRAALAESLRRASALAADFDIDLSKTQSVVGAEAELLCEVQQAVERRCSELGAATIQSLVGRVSKRVSEASLAGRGFLKLSPRLRRLGLSDSSPLEPGPTSGTDSVTQENALAKPAVVVAADELDELERIARWCHAQIDKRPDARLLVVLPGSAGARERLATLVRQEVDPRSWLDRGAGQTADGLVAIEGGASLADLPVVAHVLSTLKWVGGSSVEFEEVSEWLRAPYWDAPNAGARAQIDLWLRERGCTELNREWASSLKAQPADLADAWREWMTQLSLARGALRTGTASPRDWSERFRDVLEAVHWPGSRARGSSEQQTVVRLHELLDEFGQLASSMRSMSCADAIQWFTELAGRTAFRPADDDAAVTISRTLADPVVLYDGIWVAGLHADAFPQPVQPDPFLPLTAQLDAGVPAASAHGRLSEACALVAAWRRSTDELVLSAPARADDLELLPSPLLSEWMNADAESAVEPAGVSAAQEEANRTEGWLANRIHRDNLLESLEDAVGTPWPSGRALPSGSRSLEVQNLCAFRAYAELRLGSGELDVPEPGVAPDVRGNLIHNALQRLWKRLGDSHTLGEQSETTLERIITQSVSEAAMEVLMRPPEEDTEGEHRPLLVREVRRAVRLIKTLCALERERPPFRVEHTELEKTFILVGAPIKVRIDRLDALEAGGRAILDYKTGSRKTADWYGERPSHTQLLTYLAAIGEDAAAMTNVHVTARDVRFDGIASSSQLLPKVKGVEAPHGQQSGDAWQIRTREWLACVERLASDFLAGRATVDPKPGACDWCQSISVCRISDRGIDVVAEVLPITFEGNDV